MESFLKARQRAASLVPLPSLLDEFGIPFEAVLAGTGIVPTDIQANRFIPYAAYLAIVEAAANLTGCDDIGLRLGRRQTLKALGPLGEVMRHAATLGAAMADFAAFQISNSTGAAVYMHRVGDEVCVGYGIYDPESPTSPHTHDIVLAVGCNLVNELTDGAVNFTECLTMRLAPADAAPWRALGVPVRFGQEQTCMYLSRSAASFPLPLADPAAYQAAVERLASGIASARWGWTGRVRHALRSLLVEGRTTMPEVAGHLRIHPRTLRRGLDKEGRTFQSIKDEVRFAVARELLSLTRIPVSDLSLSLGFESTSAFIRAFQRWSGSTPAAWRDKSAPTRPNA